MKNKQIHLVLVFFILALLSLACNLSDVAKIFGEYPTVSGDLLFQEGFSDPSSGWDQVRTEEGITDYEGGTYRIEVNKPNADFWANPGLMFQDVAIDVYAGKVSGPNDNDYGVLCRYQDVKNFYFLIISSDGYYGIGIVKNGEQQLLAPPQMYYSEFINPGGETNHILAVCSGADLKLIVNGELLAEARDFSFSEGDIGLIVGTFELAGVDVWFDNLTVRVP
jgi:hypothetical protein